MSVPPLSPVPNRASADSSQAKKPTTGTIKPHPNRKQSTKVARRHKISSSSVQSKTSRKQRGEERLDSSLRDERPKSRAFTPSVREASWQLFDIAVATQMGIAVLVALGSLSVGMLNDNHLWLFLMALLLAACSGPGLYYIYQNDIETGVTVFCILQLVSATCTLAVCTIAIIGQDNFDFTLEERAYVILIFVVWQFATVIATSVKPYHEVSKRDLMKREKQLGSWERKASAAAKKHSTQSKRGKADVSSQHAPKHVALQIEPERQKKLEHIERYLDDTIKHRDAQLASSQKKAGTGICGAQVQSPACDLKRPESIAPTVKMTTQQGPVGTKGSDDCAARGVNTSTTGLVKASSDPAPVAKPGPSKAINNSSSSKQIGRSISPSASDIDVAMQSMMAPTVKQICPTPASSVYVESSIRP